MIKINLLPVKRKKKPKPMPMYLVGTVAIIILMVGGYFGLKYWMTEEIKRLEKVKADNEAKLAELAKKIEEGKKFEALNKTFTDRKRVIEELRADQKLPAQIMDELSRRLVDGVWITSLNFDPKTGINLAGMGFNNADIVSFVASLRDSLPVIFTDVLLLGTQRTSMSGADTYSFNISMKVAGNGPKPAGNK